MTGAPEPNKEGRDPQADTERTGDAFTPVFRAITTPRKRRGIRLETIYWQSLKKIAETERTSLGETVERAMDEASGVDNLASVLRVSVTRWLSDRVRTLEALTQIEAISPLVHASPAPTFVITAEKRIVLYNRPLLNLIQSRFPNARADIVYKGLRLSVDTQIDQVIQRLKMGEGTVLSTGFVLGVEGQRLRGLLNFVLAPVHKQSMVIAYITDVVESGG